MNAKSSPTCTDEEKLQLLFRIQQAYLERTKTTFSLLFLCWHPSCEFTQLSKVEQYDLLYQFLGEKVRNTDHVFWDEEQRFVIAMLAFTGEQESRYFYRRIVESAQKELTDYCQNGAPTLLATSSVIANHHFTLQEVRDKNNSSLEQLKGQPPNTLLMVSDFSHRVTEKVKVSIIDNNPISTTILNKLVSNLSFETIELDIAAFKDGEEFLSSNWYISSHVHIVILDYILPKKNGLEVTHTLRNLPNDEKYFIILISDRDAEDTVTHAFDQGADAYFKRPFNLRLLETQIKNILRRLHR